LLSQNVNIQTPKHWSFLHEMDSKFFKSRHRYSSYNRDRELVSALRSLYGNICDGYIANIHWPSKFHDGYFNKELCIFNPLSRVTQKGGGTTKLKTKRHNEEPIGDTWNRMNNKWEDGEIERIENDLFNGTNIDAARLMPVPP
jgi:hypothetical protein